MRGFREREQAQEKECSASAKSMTTNPTKPKSMNWILFAYLTVLFWGVYGVILHIGRGGMPAGAEAGNAGL